METNYNAANIPGLEINSRQQMLRFPKTGCEWAGIEAMLIEVRLPVVVMSRLVSIVIV